MYTTLQLEYFYKSMGKDQGFTLCFDEWRKQFLRKHEKYILRVFTRVFNGLMCTYYSNKRLLHQLILLVY